MRVVKIHLFAVLKDVFEDDVITVSAEEDTTIEELKNILAALKHETKAVLNSCRVAINEEFRQSEEKIGDAENIYILPPSSGG